MMIGACNQHPLLSHMRPSTCARLLTLPFPLFSKLGLYLPHPIHDHEGKAQFFSEREELEVTLLMKRAMDFFNM